MIFSFATNSTPMPLSGMAKVDTFIAGATPLSELETEWCYCDEADYIEYAFYSTDSLPHKNDYTSVLVRKFFSSETFAIKIYKDGVYKTTITDSTYGTYYGFGDLTYSYYKGIILQWKLLADVYGNGLYQIVVERIFGGVTTTKTSHIYRVMPYSAEAANGTIKIESYQNGNYILSDYAFRDMSWFQSVRIYGMVIGPHPKLESTVYVNSNRQHDQIYDKVTNEYDIELGVLPNFIANEITYNQALANEIYVTDYNKWSYNVVRRLPIKLVAYSETEYFNKSRRVAAVIKVTDRIDGIIKTY